MGNFLKSDLKQKYYDLLSANKKAKENPDRKELAWKRDRIKRAYQDALLKTKMPPKEIIDMEREIEKQFDENDQFRFRYKESVIDDLNNKSSEAKKEESAFKEQYKKDVLKALSVESEKDTSDKRIAEEAEEKSKHAEEIRTFEEKYGFEIVYKLKKEVLDEIKQMELSDEQRKRLEEIETKLDQEKENYKKQQQQSNKENSLQR